MNLSDFISQTLIGVQKGVEEANKATNDRYFISANQNVVKFNVAIEVGKESTSGRGGGIRIQVIEGKIEGSSKSIESNVSRIEFTVGVKSTIQ